MDKNTGRIYSEAESLAAAERGAKLVHLTPAEERILRNIPSERRVEALAAIRALGGAERIQQLSKDSDLDDIEATLRGLKIEAAKVALRAKSAQSLNERHPLARVVGESDEDHRATKNALKRARRARRDR